MVSIAELRASKSGRVLGQEFVSRRTGVTFRVHLDPKNSDVKIERVEGGNIPFVWLPSDVAEDIAGFILSGGAKD